jgi:hypothetical protein
MLKSVFLTLLFTLVLSALLLQVNSQDLPFTQEEIDSNNELVKKISEIQNERQMFLNNEAIKAENPKIPMKQIYANLKTTISSVRKSCGQVCDQSVQGIPGKYYDFIEKKVDCKELFSNPDIDDPSQFPDPPGRIPKWLSPEYNYGGRVPIKNNYMDDSKGETHALIWSKELFELLENQRTRKYLKGETFKQAPIHENHFF